jgi:hypothetical protein
MDLAQYKKAWKNQPEEKNKVSSLEIYKMTQSKSTSIAKWIFIIGIAEFVLWTVLNFLFSGLSYVELYEKLDLMKFINFTYYLHFPVVALFLIIFYRNYASVSSIDNTKTLMKKIIRVRRTVKFYVLYNILGTIILMIIFNIIIVNTPGALKAIYEHEGLAIPESEMLTVYVISQAVVIAVVLLFQFLFYYLLYGILLKRLRRNYKELTKLEEINT